MAPVCRPPSSPSLLASLLRRRDVISLFSFFPKLPAGFDIKLSSAGLVYKHYGAHASLRSARRRLSAPR